jgi:hypothetical protein
MVGGLTGPVAFSRSIGLLVRLAGGTVCALGDVAVFAAILAA